MFDVPLVTEFTYLLTCRRLKEKIEHADDVKAVAALSEPDEMSSTSVVSPMPERQSRNDVEPVDVVTDTATTAQTTAPAPVASPPAVTVERQRCKEVTDTDDVSQDQDVDKQTSRETMLSPTTKVECVSGRGIC